MLRKRFINVPDEAVLDYLNNTQQGQQYLQALGLSSPVARAPQVACDFNTPIPQVSITAPNGGQTVQGTIQINGQVTGTDFQSYVLEYATTTQPDQFFAIGGTVTQQQPTVGNLGVWDTTGVPNGEYILRIAVTSTRGGRVERVVQPVIVNNLIPTATATAQPLPATLPPEDPNFTPLPMATLSP